MSDSADYSPQATGEGAVQFVDHAIKKGYLKAPTGQAMKVAVKEVLSATEGDDWEKTDLTSLNLEDTLHRFETLRAMKFSSGSLATYKGRFTKTLRMFEAFRANPSGSGWHSEVKTRKGRGSQKGTNGSEAPAKVATSPETPTSTPHSGRVNIIKYPFPIRDGVLAAIELPADVTKREAKRLCAFIDSLAIEEMGQLPPGPPALTAGNEA